MITASLQTQSSSTPVLAAAPKPRTLLPPVRPCSLFPVMILPLFKKKRYQERVGTY
jgi:hypothetical protein